MSTVQTIDYESDFSLWIEETVTSLKSQNFQQVDWENLIEEVESLGRSQRSAVRSYLVRLLEHLLKRCYGSIPEVLNVEKSPIKSSIIDRIKS